MLCTEVEAVQYCREPNSFVPPGQDGPCRSAPQPHPLFASQRDISSKKPNSSSEAQVEQHITLSSSGRGPILSGHMKKSPALSTIWTHLGARPPGQPSGKLYSEAVKTQMNHLSVLSKTLLSSITLPGALALSCQKQV